MNVLYEQITSQTDTFKDVQTVMAHTLNLTEGRDAY